MHLPRRVHQQQAVVLNRELSQADVQVPPPVLLVRRSISLPRCDQRPPLVAHRRVSRLACRHAAPAPARFHHRLDQCRPLVARFRHRLVKEQAPAVLLVDAQVLDFDPALVLVLALVEHAPEAPALGLVDLVLVLVLVALVLVVALVVLADVLVLVLALVAPVAHAPVVALAVLAAVLVPVVALVVPVDLVAVLVVHAMVNVVHRARSREPVVVVSSKNCSRSSLNTPTAMHQFPREQSLLSVDHRLRSLLRS